MLILELNPPKPDNLDLTRFRGRVKQVEHLVHALLLTDSAGGHPRLSPTAAQLVTGFPGDVIAALRCGDRNLNAIIQAAIDAEAAHLKGLLLLRGDEPLYGRLYADVTPIQALKFVKQFGFHLEYYLPLSWHEPLDSIRRKEEAEPDAFVTQPYTDISTLQEYIENCTPPLIPSIMIPSRLNAKAAQLCRIDFSRYSHPPYTLIQEGLRLCGHVILTSPNDFNAVVHTLTAFNHVPQVR